MTNDFYDITHDGVRLTLPRVTSILRIIDKSGPLMGWAVNCERRAFQAALEDVLTQPGTSGFQDVYERVTQAVTGKRAWVRESDRAKDIGGQAHALIEWHVHRMLGRPVGDEPQVSDPALRAVLAWLDWCKAVDFTPVDAERIVYCPQCMFAGTLDCIAKVEGKVLLIDWKTGKAVYPESYLQNVAYRHAAAREGIETEGGMIVRLPKTAQDPLPEAVPVPPTPYSYFRAAKVLWMWQRYVNQDGAGPQMTRCAVDVNGRDHRLRS